MAVWATNEDSRGVVSSFEAMGTSEPITRHQGLGSFALWIAPLGECSYGV